MGSGCPPQGCLLGSVHYTTTRSADVMRRRRLHAALAAEGCGNSSRVEAHHRSQQLQSPPLRLQISDPDQLGGEAAPRQRSNYPLPIPQTASQFTSQFTTHLSPTQMAGPLQAETRQAFISTKVFRRPWSYPSWRAWCSPTTLWLTRILRIRALHARHLPSARPVDYDARSRARESSPPALSRAADPRVQPLCYRRGALLLGYRNISAIV